mgnify:CR=1 FL=1
MKKSIGFILFIVIFAVWFIGCKGKGSDAIVVVSREDGSGTRGAFIELLGIEEKDADGNKIDTTTDEAIVVNSTSIVVNTVAGNRNAIGYISLSSLNDSVNAVRVDGTEASVKNIKSNSYKVFRPFIIATGNNISELAKDFISFILSSDGQGVVEDNGYIPVSEAGPYEGVKPLGKIVVAGSSSVTPVMEKLKEAYLEQNSDAEIEIQLSDSTTGLNMAIEGNCDIAMASRTLKDSELEKLEATVIALDGLAIIVNRDNPVNELSSEQIKSIFKGEIKSWEEISG